jgi:hypothetical protein
MGRNHKKIRGFGGYRPALVTTAFSMSDFAKRLRFFRRVSSLKVVTFVRKL